MTAEAMSWRARRRAFVKGLGKTIMARVAELFRRQSKIGATPRFDKSVFPWIDRFETHWQNIDRELESILNTSGKLPTFDQVSPDQRRISKGDNWHVYPLFAFGDPFEENCARCPVTSKLLAEVPDIRNAMFSILAPRYHIPPHCGPTNGIIRIHLGLRIPADAASCRIRVGDEIFHWRTGECVVFDDYYEHEVWNDTDETRVVLFFDVDRPMRPLGRLVNKALIGIFKYSAYVRDAKRNVRNMNEAR